MIQVLNVCIPSFEYKGQKRCTVKRQNTQSFRKTSDMKERLEECIRGTGSARSDFINRRKDRSGTEKLRWRKDQMPYRYGNNNDNFWKISVLIGHGIACIFFLNFQEPIL